MNRDQQTDGGNHRVIPPYQRFGLGILLILISKWYVESGLIELSRPFHTPLLSTYMTIFAELTAVLIFAGGTAIAIEALIQKARSVKRSV